METKMIKVRKKSIEVEAILWDGQISIIEHLISIRDTRVITYNPEDKSLTIKTLEGDMKANLYDWVIKGVSGEFYPIKPDIFEKTYDIIGK